MTLKPTDSTAAGDPNVYSDAPPQLDRSLFSYDDAPRMLSAAKTVDSGEASDTTFAYNNPSKLTDTWAKHFGVTTAKHAGSTLPQNYQLAFLDYRLFSFYNLVIFVNMGRC